MYELGTTFEAIGDVLVWADAPAPGELIRLGWEYTFVEGYNDLRRQSGFIGRANIGNKIVLGRDEVFMVVSYRMSSHYQQCIELHLYWLRGERNLVIGWPIHRWFLPSNRIDGAKRMLLDMERVKPSL